MPADDLSPEALRKDFAPPPAPEIPKITNMGDVLVLLTACGHRLDKIMGEEDYRKIQHRLHLEGLLKADGEPTALGDKVAAQFFVDRKVKADLKAANDALAAAVQKQTPSNN